MSIKSSNSTFFPYTDEPIDFRIKDREEPIHGSFVHGNFHSRFADYDVHRVQSWRHAHVDAAHEEIVEPHAASRRWFTPIVRVAKLLLSRDDGVIPEMTQRSRARIHIQRVCPVTPLSGPTRYRTDSNQMSS